MPSDALNEGQPQSAAKPDVAAADPVVQETFESAMGNPAVVEILSLLVLHKEDPEFLDKVWEYVQQILPKEMVGIYEHEMSKSESTATTVIKTRDLISILVKSALLKRFISILVVHQYNEKFLRDFSRFFDKKDPILAKKHFMEAIIKVGLDPQNTQMLKMISSPYALEITSEQAQSISPIVLKDDLMADLNDILEHSFSIHYTKRKPKDFDQGIVFSHEGDQTGDFHQVVWLYKSDGGLMAMFISHADEEWLLSFRDCYVNDGLPEKEQDPLFDPSDIGVDSGLRAIPSQLLIDRVLPPANDEEIVIVHSDGSATQLENADMPINPDPQISVSNIVDEGDDYGEITIQRGRTSK